MKQPLESWVRRSWRVLVSCSAATSGTPVAGNAAAAAAIHSYIVEADSTDKAAQRRGRRGRRSRLATRRHRRRGSQAHRSAARQGARGARRQADHAQRTHHHAGGRQRARQLRSRLVRQQQRHAPLVRRLGRAERRQQPAWRQYDHRLERSRQRPAHPADARRIYRRAATPSSSPNVTLKFKSLRNGLEYGEYVSVQASANGGLLWTEVGRISGPANDTQFVNQSYNITATAAATPRSVSSPR